MQGNWIWNHTTNQDKNSWVCFRTDFILTSPEQATIKIAADCRYSLYVNGYYLGRGPVRYWPHTMPYDLYDPTPYLKAGKNNLSVLVNHYGTSTSQTLQASAGLWFQLETIQQGQPIKIVSDSGVKTSIHKGFSRFTSRVNVSQPWVEVFDSNKMDNSWIQPEFSTKQWENARIQPDSAARLKTLVPCDMPPMTDQQKLAKNILAKQEVNNQGQTISIDYKPNFYPDDFGTTDKLQLGYIFSILEAPQEMDGQFTLISKKWPFTQERLAVNGQLLLLDEKEKTISIHLQKGKNLFVLDISGAYQRFTVDLFFHFPQPIGFSLPLWAKAGQFASAGPFDAVEIGNIVCAEGFEVNWENRDYTTFILAKKAEDLSPFQGWVKTIQEQDLDWQNCKSLAVTRTITAQHPVLPQDNQMLIANDQPTLFPPCENKLELVIDFGREVSGYLQMDVTAEEAVRLDFLGFEYLRKNGPEIPDDLNNSMAYITKPGRQSYRFYRRAGFRYLILTLGKHQAPVKIHRLWVQESNYPMVEQGSFTCSDELLNKIWDISKETLRLCMEDAYVDCPGYEQAYWIGDARTTALMQEYVFGATGLTQRCLLLAAGSLYRAKVPECHLPAGVSFTLTAWSLLWMISCKDCHDIGGDDAFLQEIFPSLKQTAEAFIQMISPLGVLEIDAWNMFDWAEMDTPFQGMVAHQNGLLVKALTDTATLARRLEDTTTACRFEQVAEELRQAINRVFWNETQQAYVDCVRANQGQSKVISLQTNSVLALCGCVPPNRLTAILPYFQQKPANFVDMGSPFAYFFKFEILHGLQQNQTILDDIRREWGVMLEYGTATCWETFIGFYKERLTRSYCHAWSAIPCYALGAYVLGVKNTGIGFSSAQIAPNTADLRWANGRVPTRHGAIEVEWEIVEECLLLSIKAPKAISLDIKLPEEYKTKHKLEIIQV